MYRERPGVMLLGLIPAVLVFIVFATGIFLLVANSEGVAATLTPFADGWSEEVRDLFRLLVALVLVVAVLFVAMASFTGLTLIVGDPFYERIWVATERHLGGTAPDDGPGFWTSTRDTLRLMVIGMGASIIVFTLGLVPGIGTLIAFVLGLLVSGRLLASELLGRPLGARGMTRRDRSALYRRHRGPVLGFGVAAQAFFLVPFAPVVMLPAAVAGSTMLARELESLELRAQAEPSPVVPGIVDET